MKKLVGIVLVVLAVFLVAETFAAWKQSKNDLTYNTITVTGTGEVFAVSDIASFSFSVNEEGASVPDAQKKATEKSNKAIKYLKDAGIEEKDIKTTNYSVNPKYEYKPCTIYNCPSPNGTIIGYEVNQSVTVKIRKVDTAGKILSDIGETGVSNISGLSFTIDDEDALKAQARSKAIEDAKTKAKKLAQDLGVRLGKVTSFYENSEIPYYGGYGGAAPMMEKAADSRVATPPSLPKGENKISSSVSITYKIK